MGPAIRSSLAIVGLAVAATGCRQEQDQAPARIELDRGRVAMAVPPGFVRMPKPELEAIEAAREGRGVELQIVAYVAPPTQDPGSVHVAVVRHTDWHRFYGESVESFTAHAFAAELQSLSKGVGVDLPMRAEVGEGHVEVRTRGTNASGKQAAVTARVMAPSEEEIVERLCFCEGSGCGQTPAECEFHPPDAAPVPPRQPLMAGKGLERILLPSGCVEGRVPPFYELSRSTDLGADVQSSFDAWKDPFDSALAHVDPDDPSRFIQVGCRRHCEAEETCSLDEVVRRTAAALEAPGASVEVTHDAEARRAAIELIAGDRWQTHWLWVDEGGVVHEDVCGCGSAGCLVAASTCRSPHYLGQDAAAKEQGSQ